jgi:antitoxin (DNA-binding transcriptional repressor) of toxin-antitoxin stability system
MPDKTTDNPLTANAAQLPKHRVDLEQSPDLAAMIGRSETGEPVILCRDGEPVAVMMSVYHAGFAFNMLDRHADRRPPFTQEALDAWIDKQLGQIDLAELLCPDLSTD